MHLERDHEAVLNETGASMLEYAMMAALIAIVCIAGVTSLGEQTRQTFLTAGDAMDESMDLPATPPPF